MNDSAFESEQAVIERTVLGCLAGFCDELKEYIPQLSGEDFTVCPGAFEILNNCYESGSISTSVILAKFAERGKMSFIKDCILSAPVIHEFGPAFKRLRELSVERRLEQGITELLISKTLNAATLQRLIDDEQAKSGVQSDEATCERNLEAYMENLGKPYDSILTGFPTVDKTLSGIRKKAVCYIGARPSTGKTAFAINIAQAQKQRKVLFFSLEMSAAMIYDRYAASALLMEYDKFTGNKLSSAEIDRVREYLEAVQTEKRFLVLDDIFGIEAMVNAVMSIRPDIVIIDYIQKVTTTKRFFQPRESIEYISSELKKLAKLANCAVICLSQLSRNGTEYPRMSDLKESGALEADGDYIFLLHRPFVLSKDESIDPAECDLLIDKNKFGKTGLIKMHFAGEFQKFFEAKEISKAEKL